MVVDAILERNPEVSFKSSIDMDRVSIQQCVTGQWYELVKLYIVCL